jgi:hypothetical protein
VRSELPLDDSFTILKYNEGGVLLLDALSPWDALKTAQWMLARLGELGYDSGDNPSRLLEGATYLRGSGKYRELYIKVGLNTADQCTIEYRSPPPG